MLRGLMDRSIVHSLRMNHDSVTCRGRVGKLAQPDGCNWSGTKTTQLRYSFERKFGLMDIRHRRDRHVPSVSNDQDELGLSNHRAMVTTVAG